MSTVQILNMSLARWGRTEIKVAEAETPEVMALNEGVVQMLKTHFTVQVHYFGVKEEGLVI